MHLVMIYDVTMNMLRTLKFTWKRSENSSIRHCRAYAYGSYWIKTREKKGRVYSRHRIDPQQLFLYSQVPLRRKPGGK